MRKVVKSWAAYRTTDRQTVRKLININESLRLDVSDYKAKDQRSRKDITTLNTELRECEDEGARKDIAIMNMGADMAPLKTWAAVGKWGTGTVCVAAVVAVAVVVKQAVE